MYHFFMIMTFCMIYAKEKTLKKQEPIKKVYVMTQENYLIILSKRFSSNNWS